MERTSSRQPRRPTLLWLVRHGETVDNVRRVIQGQTQGELTATGIAQAEQLAEQWRDEHIDGFVASDLKRSIDTCVIIAAPHGAPVVTTALLREREWGDFTGQYIPDLKDKPWPDNVESSGTLKHRARQFLNWIKRQYPGMTVVAVGHGIINKAIQAVYYHKEMKEIPPMANGERRILEIF